VDETDAADRKPDLPGDIPFGYRFGVDDDGTPNVVDSQGRWDALTLWLDDNKYPSYIAEHLAAIDDVVARRRELYRAHFNASNVYVDSIRFEAAMSVGPTRMIPELVGSFAQLRTLLERWAEHLERIGWTDES
jgi:hypothetical protein